MRKFKTPVERPAGDADMLVKILQAEASSEIMLLDRWYPRALDMFGHSDSAASRQAIEWDIKKWDNDEVRAMYVEEVGQVLRDLGLTVPPPNRDRRIA